MSWASFRDCTSELLYVSLCEFGSTGKWVVGGGSLFSFNSKHHWLPISLFFWFQWPEKNMSDYSSENFTEPKADNCQTSQRTDCQTKQTFLSVSFKAHKNKTIKKQKAISFQTTKTLSYYQSSCAKWPTPLPNSLFFLLVAACQLGHRKTSAKTLLGIIRSARRSPSSWPKAAIPCWPCFKNLVASLPRSLPVTSNKGASETGTSERSCYDTQVNLH